jgi:hypothetical protein
VKVKLSTVAVVAWVLASAALWAGLHWRFRRAALHKAEEALVCMCEERARMLQDQFAVSVNHVHALAILVATFHYDKHPPALDQVGPNSDELFRRRRDDPVASVVFLPPAVNCDNASIFTPHLARVLRSAASSASFNSTVTFRVSHGSHGLLLLSLAIIWSALFVGRE